MSDDRPAQSDRSVVRPVFAVTRRGFVDGPGEGPAHQPFLVARLLDNFAGELSCLRSCIRLRQQEGQNPDADRRALSVEANG
jgi:hypothetical protein